ncbi:hypothetical protein CDAR_537701 [Caerostris darwini]|uniref:Uncharacterized protein n=1 Tax=Caerostris darwini TaxID=1538125 RepID=A0AAV4W1R7_9ARAC|nr:hypothetical protein CDAR_537701 [Caerostris darwini]
MELENPNERVVNLSYQLFLYLPLPSLLAPSLTQIPTPTFSELLRIRSQKQLNLYDPLPPAHSSRTLPLQGICYRSDFFPTPSRTNAVFIGCERREKEREGQKENRRITYSMVLWLSD